MTKIHMPELINPLISLAFLNARLFCKAKNHLIFKHAISQLIDNQQLAMGWLCFPVTFLVCRQTSAPYPLRLGGAWMASPWTACAVSIQASPKVGWA